MTATPPTWSCDTHKRNRELKQRHLLLGTLLAELHRATNYWLQAKRTHTHTAITDDDDCFHLLAQTCVTILQHGFSLSHRPSAPAGESLQRLIDDFEFLRLNEQKMSQSLSVAASAASPPPRNAAEFLRSWVGRCLRSRCLSQCLQSLVADKELLECYYPATVDSSPPFLRQSGYATALFVCLTAIQLNQSSLLSQLDAQLLQPAHRQLLNHRRTSSQPNFVIAPTSRLLAVPEEAPAHASARLKRTLAPHFRRVKSLPCLLDTPLPAVVASKKKLDQASRRQTFSNASGSPRGRWSGIASPSSHDELDMLPSTSAGSRRSRLSTDSCSSSSTRSSGSSCITLTAAPCRIQLINCDDIKIWTDQSCAAAAAAPKDIATQPKERQSQAKRASPLNNFLTNLFGSPPVYTSWYPAGDAAAQAEANPATADSVLDSFMPVDGRKLRKRQTQNLFEDAGVSMLDYNGAADAGAASMPLAMPSSPLDIVGAGGGGSSQSKSSCSMSSESNKSKIQNNQSLATFLQMSRYTHNNTDLEKENAHFRISEACITAIEHVKWSRQTVGSSPTVQALAQLPYAEQLAGEAANDVVNGGTSSSLTAEAVGLQLISKFHEQQLPKLSELKWLVSEEDAPQQLLPMPKQEEQQSGMTRGTKTWAPPRQQIIFTEHAPASRAQLLTRQNYRCAGCGMRVTKQLQQHFRYCSYLGKYLCTGCHRNQISAIPSKILQAWDFRCYPVSVFAYRLIEQMYSFPLFHVPDLHAQLYAKHKALATARRRRIQLQFVRDFIRTCRFASKEQAFFAAIPAHITSDVDMWSMSDFVDVQNKSMTRSIEQLIELSEQHVNNCVLCTGRAFVCEYCDGTQLLYPWQRKVQRCGDCGACAHQSCWRVKRERCKRCVRLTSRQKNQKVVNS